MAWGRYDGKPLQVHATPKDRERIAAIAEREHVSMASVVRDLIDAGLDDRERVSLEAAQTGEDLHG
jgi:predicted transcriptional regulator